MYNVPPHKVHIMRTYTLICTLLREKEEVQSAREKQQKSSAQVAVGAIAQWRKKGSCTGSNQIALEVQRPLTCRLLSNEIS